MVEQISMEFLVAAERATGCRPVLDIEAAEASGPGSVTPDSPSASVRTVREQSDIEAVTHAAAGHCAIASPILHGAERPATLRACLDHVTVQGRVSASQLTCMRSAVSRIEKIIRAGMTDASEAVPVELPAAPEVLRPILNGVMPAVHDISRKRWSNIRSAITALLIACGWVSVTARSSAPLPEPWADLLARAVGHNSAKPLPPFVRYCAARSLCPEDVTASVLADYEDWRRRETLTVNPCSCVHEVKSSWNKLALAEPDLGLAQLSLGSRVNWKGARIDALPASFAEELGAYLRQLRHPDRLNPRHGRACAEITVQHARRALLRAAAYLIESGRRPGSVTALSALVEPAAFRNIIELADAANPKPDGHEGWSHLAVTLAGTLIRMARQWADPDPATLAELEAVQGMVKGPRGGLSRRNRDRLAQFAEADARKELFDLPGRGFAEADKCLAIARNGRGARNKGYRAAKLHETALALGILLVQPLRRHDLAMLDTTRHLRRDRHGRIARLVIQTSKTHREIDASIPPALATRIERHLAVFRPLLPGAAASTALFPGEGGGSRAPDSLGRQITKLVARQLGATFSPHLARHLAAEMLLDADPGNMVVLQRLLGHGTLSRTQEMYGVTRTSAAQKAYVNLVEKLRDRPAAGRGARRKPGR